MRDESTWTIDSEFFHRLFINGWIVDARAGGLIVGRGHDEGHILMFSPAAELGEFSLVGFVEGGEFIMGTEATAAHFDELDQLNRDNSPSDSLPFLDRSSRIINTCAEPHDKFLIVRNQFIINRNATNRHFSTLQRLNNLYPSHSGRVLNDEEIQAISQLRFD